MSNYADRDGEFAVRRARTVVDNFTRASLISPPALPSKLFMQKSGVFVTLENYPGLSLRGCIGFPEPHFKLIEAIDDAAKSACRDPRFPALKKDELERIVIEVSLLTVPEKIQVSHPREYPENVEVGQDGLILSKGVSRGLLLPQVATEYEWDSAEFLSQTCMKAGVAPDSWLSSDTVIYKFQAEIFCETKPYGPIRRKEIGGKS